MCFPTSCTASALQGEIQKYNMIELLETLKSNAGVGIAALGALIAAAQWHTNRTRLQLDTYERRLRVYKAAVALLEEAVSEITDRRSRLRRFHRDPELATYREPPATVLDSFKEGLLEAPFLFGEDVTYFMTRIESTRGLVRMYALGLADAVGTSARSRNATHVQALIECEESLKDARSRAWVEFESYLRLNRF